MIKGWMALFQLNVGLAFYFSFEKIVFCESGQEWPFENFQRILSRL
jgi:hypothetical protein